MLVLLLVMVNEKRATLTYKSLIIMSINLGRNQVHLDYEDVTNYFNWFNFC